MKRNSRYFALLALLVCLTAAFSSAVAQGAAQVQLSTSGSYGAHLATAGDGSLYLYLKDEQGADSSACVDSCTRNWPPLLTDGEPVAAEGVDAALIGTVERPEGTQVTYNGWPLYTYARDSKPGDTLGQKLGNAFFLLSPAGDSLTEEVAQDGPEVSAEAFEELMTVGEQAYASSCAACHGAEGEGLLGPAMAANPNLSRSSFVAGRILNGFIEHGMPPFAHLSDEQVAGISTFVRNSWTNEFGAVTPEEVNELR
jgi:predicted lipoprotein with Yx(FWY)xxD motif